MPDVNSLDIIEKAVTVAAIIVGGAWVYLNAIRGRIFIPRLMPKVSGKLIFSKGKQYLLVNLQIENVGSSIAKVNEKGTGLLVKFQQAIGDGTDALDLYTTKNAVFPVFDLMADEKRLIEPDTTIYSQELIEVPTNKYDAFRLVFRVNTDFLYWSYSGGRRMRAIAVVPEEKT
jgi:hypothetical protein